MKIFVFETVDKLYDDLASLYINAVRNNPKITLGLATGSTVIPLYERLINDYKSNQTSYKTVKTFNLDEYIGLNYEHQQSYAYFMDNYLFKHIDINRNNINLLNGKCRDINEECLNYDKLLENNPIDIQLLGIGTNGHIAFNEPGTSFDSKTLVVKLTEETLKSNSRFFNNIEEVPKTAITMGLKSIMDCKKVILVATGVKKAQAIKDVISGEISVDIPASILKTHEDVIIYLDKAAASLL